MAAVLAVALAGWSCSKPKPPIVVTLQPEPPDGSSVRHTIISLRSGAPTIVLNMEILNPAEFSSYKATLARGTEVVESADRLTMSPSDLVRMDVDAAKLPPAEYTVRLEAADEKGKLLPVAVYNFRTIR